MGHYDNCRDDHIPEVGKMVLVPREPTPEMRRAANDCAAKFNPGRSTDHIGSVAFDAQSIYRAMVDAAPQPSMEGEMTAEEVRRENLKQMAAYAGPIVSLEVREPYYLASCDLCGWFGSSELCGTDTFGDDSDVYCPRCYASGADCGKLAERFESLSADNARLRQIVSDSAAALPNGAFISTETTVDFMARLPDEIRTVCARLDSQGGGNG